MIRTPGSGLLVKLVPAALPAALVLAVVYAVTEDVQLILRSR
jgi:hypothetical protein